MVMVDTKHAPHGGYSPDMDGPAHEATYRGFIRFAEIGTVVVLCHVLSLAVGGVKHAWLSAILGVVLSTIAETIGADVAVQAGAGTRAGIPDAEFEAAGASLAASAREALSGADLVLKVRR